MIAPQELNLKDDHYFRSQGWRAISRDDDGHAMSAIAPGYEDCFNEWVHEQSEYGYTVVELHQRES